MLRNPAWQAADEVTRAQFTVFHACCDQAGLQEADRRQALGLDDGGWAAWQDFLENGPLPSEPALPEMLQRIGASLFQVSVVAERRSEG